MVFIPEIDTAMRPDESPTSQARRQFVNQNFTPFSNVRNTFKVYGIQPLNFVDNYAMLIMIIALGGFLFY